MMGTAPTASIYFGHNRGYRAGFTVTDDKGGVVYDSGLVHNDEQHVTAALNRYLSRKDKDGFPLRGSNVSLNKHGELGRKALRFVAGNAPVKAKSQASRAA